MNILVCPDKFKGSLTARQVCEVIKQAIKEALPDAHVHLTPLADGGEGTGELLTERHHGEQLVVDVFGPLFETIAASYGVSGDGQTAFIEMATASGLTLLKPHERNPLHTTSLGTGQLIAHALGRGVSQVVLGIGGSATNDAGIGMATALGYSFLDASGKALKPTGGNLVRIRSIRKESVHPRLRETDFICLSDVTNPLSGPQGAAHVYGPQKGADHASIELLDAGLQNFHDVVLREFGISSNFPGAGAAGGLGAGALVFLNASIRSGVSFMIEIAGLASQVKTADLVITGEGRIDSQTFSGKVVSEVVRLSVDAGKSVFAVCGICELSKEDLSKSGITRVISLVDENTTIDESMNDTTRHLHRKIVYAFMHDT